MSHRNPGPQSTYKRLFQCEAAPLIDAYESAIGARLPESYRQFLLEQNGAEFVVCPHFPIEPPDPVEGDGELSMLYGLSDVPHGDDLRWSGVGLEFRERVPDNIVAIGRTPYHERVALSVGGEDYGTIYLWRPGEPWEPEENVPTRQYLHFVARDFRDFWQLLGATLAE